MTCSHCYLFIDDMEQQELSVNTSFEIVIIEQLLLDPKSTVFYCLFRLVLFLQTISQA